MVAPRAASGTRCLVPTLASALLAMLAVAPAYAQVPPDTSTVEISEAFLEPFADEEATGDPSETIELLQDLAERPLDVNTADVEELASVPALSPRLAQRIVQHRDRAGPFPSVDALLNVEGITPEALHRARPFLTAAPAGPPVEAARATWRRDLRVDVLQRLQRRLDLPRGYDPVPDSLRGTPDEPRRYLGSPERIYTRIRMSAGDRFSANVTLEKDPGEPFTWDPSRGFYGYDFASVHVAAHDLGPVRTAVAGDFVAEFGQGVTLWRASGFGKGREPIRPIVRRGRGIRPYASTDENRFFRGIAVTAAPLPHVLVTLFASRRHYDARFAEVDTTLTPSVSSLPESGLHRTHTEIAGKNALGQSLAGAALELRRGRFTLGTAGYAARFDAPLAAGDRPYQRFQFEGQDAAMIGVFGSAALDDYYAFGEVARSPTGALGGVGGIEAHVGVLEALLLVRHYPRDFVSLHGHAFGERNGATQNESGVYLAAGLRPASRWRLSAYIDQYRFPWARFTVPRPSTGMDALVLVEHRPRRWLTLYAQARTQQRETGARHASDNGALLEGLADERRQSLRLQGEFLASGALRLRSRVEVSRYRAAGGDHERGVMLFHDVRWQPRPALIVDARLTHFDTDSFNARLYQYENDLLGVLTNTLLSGRGVRSYVVIGVRPGAPLAGLDLRVKLAATHYRDRDVIGSGLDQIEGDRVRDVGLQVRYRF